MGEWLEGKRALSKYWITILEHLTVDAYQVMVLRLFMECPKYIVIE